MLPRSQPGLWSANILLSFCLLQGKGAAASPSNSPKPCISSPIHLSANAFVHGYLFKSYEPVDIDHSACLVVYRNDRVVYRMPDNAVQRYEFGQPGLAEYKVPRVSNGADLIGNGHPDMIVSSWSGGAHCCFSRYIFELEPRFRLITSVDDGDTDLGHFERDKDRRGYDYVTWDIWSYWPDSFASSTSHKVILTWQGEQLRLNIDRMRAPAPTAKHWQAALAKVNAGVRDGEVRGYFGATLWNTVLDLIYSAHSDLAWKFVDEVNPEALKGNNASLGVFCAALVVAPYWSELKPTLTNVPKECAVNFATSRKTQ